MTNFVPCDVCVYSLKDGPNLKCRRFPPAVMLSGATKHPITGVSGFATYSDYPSTQPSNSCGEGKAKEVTNAEEN